MTIGDCRRTGKLLEIGCGICGRHGYFTHEEVNLPEHISFEAAGYRITCGRCGARNRHDPHWPLWIRPDARVTGKGKGKSPALIDRPGRDWYEQARYVQLPINAWLREARSE